MKQTIAESRGDSLKPFRIAIVGVRGIPAHYGGFETFAEDLAVYWVNSGFHVTVYCEEGVIPGPDNYKGVALKYIRVPPLGTASSLIYDWLTLRQCRKKYDLIYMLGYGSALFCAAPKREGALVWINMDGLEWARAKWPWYGQLWFKWMERRAVSIADKVICDSEQIKCHLTQRYGAISSFETIVYGTDTTPILPELRHLDPFDLQPNQYFIMVARAVPENSLLEIVTGFMKSETELPLVVVSDVSNHDSYVRKLLAYSGHRIRFIGAIYFRDHLQSLRYFALAAFHGHTVGGTNPSLLEAMSCGNLVIAHDNLFNREVAAECARYFKHSEDIPPLVSWVLRHQQEVKQKGRDARQHIENHYNIQQMFEKYATQLQKLQCRVEQTITEHTETELSVKKTDLHFDSK
ncbi:DUF1972 domain-containing protein [Ectothiorhodospiraceae bacterium BW-2]|nr:DUF1972 domain-containing protein [Ectothiorhodospiraceae bacterium BW-2]